MDMTQSSPPKFSGNDHSLYQADIDGLRALAIIPVILFHAFPEIVSGGFIGVDIFFVISGYLITGIIYNEMRGNSFSLKEFYYRRVRRIFPALLLIIAITTLAGWFLLFQHEFRQLGKHGVAGIVFASNILLLQETGYFDAAAASKPLLHLWSLGIEEQFYIIWPLILLAAIKWKKFFWAMGVLFAISLAANLIWIGTYKEAVFYLPFTRFWELMVGSLLVLLQARLGSRVNPLFLKYKDFLGFAGFAFVLWAATQFTSTDPFPGWRALIPVIGGVFLITARSCWINRHILAHPIFVGVGKISYPLYLWHWPIMAYIHIVWPDAGPMSMIIAIGTSAVFAGATYVLIEKPFRNRPAKEAFKPLALLALLLLCLEGLVYKQIITGHNDYIELQRVARASQDWKFPPTDAVKSSVNGVDIYTIAGTSDDIVLYVGDSNMEQYAPRIAELALENKPRYSATFITINGCRPFPRVVNQNSTKCLELYPAALAFIKNNLVKRIVIGGRWNKGLFESDLGYLTLDGKYLPLSDAEGRKIATEDMRLMLKYFAKNNIDIVLLQNIPTEMDDMSGPDYDRIELMLQGEDYLHSATFDAPFKQDEAIDPRGRALIQSIAQGNADVIDPIPALCPAGMCYLVKDDVRVYKDAGHLTATFAARYASYIDSTILLPGKR